MFRTLEGLFEVRFEGGEHRGLPAETKPCSGPFKLLTFLPGSESRDQDGEVANAECNADLSGAWNKVRTRQQRSEVSREDESHP